MKKSGAIDKIIKRICEMIDSGETVGVNQGRDVQSFEQAKNKAEGVQIYRDASDEEYRSYITDLLDSMLDENDDYTASDGTLIYITPEDKAKIIEQVFGMYRGLGLLDSLLMDEQITELMVNGPDNIFVEKKRASYTT